MKDKRFHHPFLIGQIVARCERVPVPLGFAWKWLETNRICFCDEDMLGVGTFSTVVFAHITEYDSGSITLTGAAMKIYNVSCNNIFIMKDCKFVQVLP